MKKSIIRRLRTGFVVLLNNMPIYWYTRERGSAEKSTFGSEFIAMKQSDYYVRSLRYRLKLFGISLDKKPIF